MRIFKIAVPVAVLMGGLFLCTSLSFGKAEYTKKEKKGCTFCHVSASSKELNEAGKYYKEHNHSLEGYTPSAKK
jgi:hypothetical protein